MVERCGHPACDFAGRAEYCLPEAADSEGSVSVVTDALDALLYDKKDAPSDEFSIRASEIGLQACRSLTYWSAELGLFGRPLLETNIAIAHTQLRNGENLYEVGVAWRVYQKGAESEPFITMYRLEQGTEGLTRATKELPNLLFSDGPRMREYMTPYDYEQLFEQLQQANSADIAAQYDNEQTYYLSAG